MKWVFIAVIEYIKSVNTSKEKIIYFGHSQGTTLMFSGLTQKFEYYKKNIKLFVALAPVARLAHIGTTLNILSKIPFYKLINKMKIYEIVPNTKLTSNFLSFMDNYASIITTFFINLIMDIIGIFKAFTLWLQFKMFNSFHSFNKIEKI